jgi:hypothetical protein
MKTFKTIAGAIVYPCLWNPDFVSTSIRPYNILDPKKYENSWGLKWSAQIRLDIYRSLFSTWYFTDDHILNINSKLAELIDLEDPDRFSWVSTVSLKDIDNVLIKTEIPVPTFFISKTFYVPID